MNAVIDFEAIRESVDLRRCIEDDLGPPRAGRWACPLHGGENPTTLSIDPDGKRWRCWSCGKSGDVTDWVAEHDRISRAEAARKLVGEPVAKSSRKPVGGSAATRPHEPSPRRNSPVLGRSGPPPVWLDTRWQAEVDRIIAEAEAALWAPAGRPALDWLRARGLNDQTIRRFRLGFVARDSNSEPLTILGTGRDGRTRSLWTRRGITIPWVRPGSRYSPAGDTMTDPNPGPRWVGCNVRRLSANFGDPLDKPKYQALTGSERGHAYPGDDVAPGMPALICEGEFDALTGWQEARHAANVFTVGGVGQTPQPDAEAALAACPDWLVITDHDQAGDKAARKLASLGRHKVRRLMLPGTANDLNDFHKSGGDLLGWIASEWARFGWSWREPDPWSVLSAQRWGPSLEHDNPGIDVSIDDWRWTVANWPVARWSAWRALAGKLLDVEHPTVTEIEAAERRAFEELTPTETRDCTLPETVQILRDVET